MPRGSTPASSASWSPSPVRRSVRSVVCVVTPTTKPQSPPPAADSPKRRSRSRISGQHRRREWKEERPGTAAEEERSVLLTSSSSSSSSTSRSSSPQLRTSPRSSRGHARRSSSQRLVRYPGSGERTVRYPSSGERTVRYPGSGERTVRVTKSPIPSPQRNAPPRKRSRSPAAKRPRTSRSPKRRRGRSPRAGSPSFSPLRSPSRRLNTSPPSPPPFRRNRNIGVFGLSRFTKNFDLEREFSRFGRVENVDLIKDKNGNSKRYGFVRFRHQEDADEAMREMDGSILDGFRVRVDYSYHAGPHSKTPGFYAGAGHYPYRRQRSYSPAPNGTTYRYRDERGRY